VSRTDLIIARIDTARVALADAVTPRQAKAIADIAQAAKIYAKRQNLGTECVEYARQLVVDAERRLGQILDVTAKAKGGQPYQSTGTNLAPVAPTLAKLGIDKKTSARAQKLAALPEEIFANVKSGKVKLTEALRGERNAQKIATARALPSDVYRLIYADPPWQYNDKRATGDHRVTTAAAHHYPTMAIDAIKAIDVPAISAPDSVLFCWATFPLLPDALELVAAWGFAYKTAFVWDKGRGSFGHYHNASAELLILSTRGRCTPDVDIREDQVQAFPRGDHSAKPKQWVELIDRMYPHGPRIELFARGAAAPGWEGWGNEAQGLAA
jgi:N6-adenosine-specific RNA methylase IME4